MLTAVQVAAVAAAAAFVAGTGVAVYVMLKAARLMSQASATVAALRERGDLLIDRANAAIDSAGEQIARTETVTASMAGVSAAMTELGGHLTALAPTPPADTEARGGPLTWAAAVAYGLRWALGTRWAASTAGQREPGRQANGRPAHSRPAHSRPAPDRGGGRRAALTGRGNGTTR